ncbi:hypothetical protein [Ponticoccus alexandrii]|uniref:Uncharacterized protein n=1 Tax=Ponticoccus alexandrii TaxID=1943633 RepID=A0ABX7F5H4_9RHOB|nr:hypothetical protein [Ponticoccus alexandrii]ETA52629.1 hypothetical protein P279_07550 [Rhodobacteraceae bacterium PD-2]QRF65552.1 hypothetical protein GQA70_03990 [Ponticoccus alexandrii]
MTDRPTFDDIRREQEDFTGPPEPAQGPKMARALTEADKVDADTLVTLSIIRRALKAGLPIDPKHLPERIVEIIEANCLRSKMPMADGRPHYQIDDVVKALDIYRGETTDE